MKIGIFGCTADPFTPAHYEIVNKVLNDKLVDEVIVIPTIVNYYRKDKDVLFDYSQRKTIIEKWFFNKEHVKLDWHEYDIAENTLNYYNDSNDVNRRRFWHTLQDVMHKYNCGSSTDFYTIIGSDSWNNLPKWYNFKELGTTTKFIVVKRAEDRLEDWAAEYSEYNMQPYHVIELDKRFASISATEIRKHLIDTCSCMGIGPSGNQFNVYMEEIEDYKENGKTYKDYEKECVDINEAIEDLLDKDKVKDAILDTEHVIAHTPIFDLVKGPMVEAGFKPVKIKSPDWVSVIVEKDGKFLMEKQLRHGLNKEFEEFPCGMIEEDEFSNVAALRELEEETGIKLKDIRCLHYLGKFAANPAFMTNYMHYYHVNLDYALYDVVDTKFDEHEHLTSYWVNKKTAFDNFIKSEGSAIMGCAWMILMKKKCI